MKLFIWEGDGVLQDYSPGMICAIGADLQDALNAIEKTCDYCMGSFPNHKPSEVVNLGEAIVQPKAWVCYGGG